MENSYFISLIIFVNCFVLFPSANWC